MEPDNLPPRNASRKFSWLHGRGTRIWRTPDFSGTAFAATALLQEPAIASVELRHGIEQDDMRVAEEERLRGGD